MTTETKRTYRSHKRRQKTAKIPVNFSCDADVVRLLDKICIPERRSRTQEIQILITEEAARQGLIDHESVPRPAETD